jgi:hypothetical protein
MKRLIVKVDTFLLEQVFQRAINATGKARGWWLEQCAYGWIVTNVLWALSPKDSRPPHSGPFSQLALMHPYIALSALVVMLTLLVAVLVLIVVIFWVASRHEPLMDVLALQRKTALVCSGTVVAINWLDGETFLAFKVVESLTQLVFVAAFYFSACKPPEKRERKRKTNFAPQS